LLTRTTCIPDKEGGHAGDDDHRDQGDPTPSRVDDDPARTPAEKFSEP
jgi:hypothetical protein